MSLKYSLLIIWLNFLLLSISIFAHFLSLIHYFQEEIFFCNIITIPKTNLCRLLLQSLALLLTTRKVKCYEQYV